MAIKSFLCSIDTGIVVEHLSRYSKEELQGGDRLLASLSQLKIVRHALCQKIALDTGNEFVHSG